MKKLIRINKMLTYLRENKKLYRFRVLAEKAGLSYDTLMYAINNGTSTLRNGDAIEKVYNMCRGRNPKNMLSATITKVDASRDCTYDYILSIKTPYGVLVGEASSSLKYDLHSKVMVTFMRDESNENNSNIYSIAS